MKKFTVIVVLFLSQVVFSLQAAAGDFDWIDNLNITAKADTSGFRVKLATRFHIGKTEVKAVIGDVNQPSDAYMVFRLSELSHRPVAEVMTVYRSHHKKGWGAMARKLGIKPGSREFHALKRGHDLDISRGHEHGEMPGNKHNKGKGKNKAKGMK